MVFSSSIFLCIFMPAVVFLNWLAPGIKSKNALLILASLIFYSFGNPLYIFLLLGSVVCNYLGGLLAAKSGSLGKTALIVTVAVNLGLLGIYKYLGFLVENLNLLPWVNLPVPQIVLPVGISFFTFQGLSYVIDVSRDKTMCNRNFFEILLYICLFPQLVAGPIVKYRDIAQEIKARSLSAQETAQGVRRFVIGLSKKLLIADVAAQVADAVFELDAAGLDIRLAWLGAIAYTLQIYFDFSGYSDMAIGLGWIFGFHFKENFDHPYSADSVKIFWRKWHISLSSWFRDYLYIPLGGNRRGRARTYINRFIVFFCTGLWHGASWNYVIWGLWHGTFLVAEDLLRFSGDKAKHIRPAKPRASCLGHVYTLLVVVIGFVIFRAGTMGQAWLIIRNMFAGFAFTPASGAALANITDRMHIATLLAGCVLSLPVLNVLKKAADRHHLLEAFSYPAVLVLYAVDIIHLSAASYVPFIYFQF